MGEHLLDGAHMGVSELKGKAAGKGSEGKGGKSGKGGEPAATKLFVGQLSPKTTPVSLTLYFSYYGQVTELDFRKDRGFAFVEFAKASSAKHALAEPEHNIDGKVVDVKRREKPSTGGAQIFVGGLAKTASEESVSEYFSHYGAIKSVRVKLRPDNGECRGFGFIEFEDPAAGDAALAEPKHIIDKSAVSVRRATKAPSNSKIFVGGLDPSATQKMLEEYFVHYGDLLQVQLKMDAETGRNRGFGFVTFADPVAAQLAVTESEEHIIGEKAVVVRMYSREGTYRLFVGGLLEESTSESVSSYFSTFGTVSKVDVIVGVSKTEGKSNVFGFVEFSDDGCEQALACLSHHIDGKKVIVKMAERKVKGKRKGVAAEGEDDEEWDEE